MLAKLVCAILEIVSVIGKLVTGCKEHLLLLHRSRRKEDLETRYLVSWRDFSETHNRDCLLALAQ
jgi:hypothetical protein